NRGGLKGLVKKVLRGEVTISDKFGNWMEKPQMPWRVVTFNVQGEVSESTLFAWVYPTNPHPCTHNVYTYDARGHRIQTLWYSVEGQTPVQLCDNAKGVFTEQGCYDTQGRLLSIEEVCRRSETLLYQ